MEIHGRAALVTGATQRIGRAIALAFGREGMQVAVHHRSPADPTPTVVEELMALEVQAVAVAADLCDAAASESLVQRAEEALGPVQVLINSASTFEAITLDDVTPAVWHRHHAVHVEAPALLSRAMARRLPAGEQGRIVNLLDWRASATDPTHLPYSVTKGALCSLTRNLAVALGPDITVNGVAPGAILLPEGDSIPMELYRDLPAGRVGTTEEVVRAVLFLIRDADYTTGAVIPVDGGKHLL